MASREEKGVKFNAILDEITTLTATMEAEEGKGNTPDNQEKLKALLADGDTLRKSIETDNAILGLKSFGTEPAGGSKAYGNAPSGSDGVLSQPFAGVKSLGEQFIANEFYKKSTAGGKVENGLRVVNEMKGFLFPVGGTKATFNLAAGGLDSTINYVNMGNPIMIEQQRLMVRDLLATGETTMNSIPFIKESTFTNYADMTAEEGEKPEATLALTTATAPVKKIAVVLKVTDEMFADFPMMRDYVNTRLSFSVKAKEEQQLLNGTGSGNQITGLLQTSGIQTQGCGSISATNPVVDSIHKAITKIRVATGTAGGYEPDGIILHPNDWQILRLTKDNNYQYFGGGPFTGAYGNATQAVDQIFGLPVVKTTAIAAGTALVGSFKMGAQIWQREGIRVEATNSNEDDFNFNRVSIRVEERLALTVYRPSAFCTVTSIA